MRSLIVASFVALFSLGCGAELPEQDVASAGQEVQAQAAACLSSSCVSGKWCLATCSRSGSTLHVVAKDPPCGTCAKKGEDFCKALDLGYRTRSCWGNP